MGPLSWKTALSGRISAPVEREIDIFETEIRLRKQGKIEERLFAETRLRRGAYGQRYDNGQRNDGTKVQALAFPSRELTKGPNTLWDAPGMQRIKIPFGALTANQMDALAEVAEEYSDGILHVTTRQDFQLHFVHIEETPDIMRRLAAVGITTREACGNTVRNVTACPLSGVCPDEKFDTTPYAEAATWFLLGHPDTQDFGRKFKIAFSGCAEHACGLAKMHDFAGVAKIRVENDKEIHGFEVFVGGGLGSVPHQAKVIAEFLPASELLPWAQAMCRVFARMGERQNRQRARVKFLVARLGIDEFKRLVEEERAKLPPDARWTRFLDEVKPFDQPMKGPGALPAGPYANGFERWKKTNVVAQRQEGYAVATVRLPLGDLTSEQLRGLAEIARRFTGDVTASERSERGGGPQASPRLSPSGSVRTTVEQNILFRWVSLADLPAVYAALSQIGLATAGAGTIADITACPGTDTCKLGISSSRGLAGELGARLDEKLGELDASVAGLRIKASGCFNSCGQHHLADIGLLGVSRNVGGRRVPHFQVVLGGQWSENGAAYGLAIGAVPSKRIPEAVERITSKFVAERAEGESFQAFSKRVGRAKVRDLFGDLLEVPSYATDPSFYSDWGDPREYTIGDMGAGECAGEVVPLALFGLSASEREVFEAQLLLDGGDASGAARRAYSAMVQAAKALVGVQLTDVPEEAERIVGEFRVRLHETKLFSDPYAGDKFAQYLFRVHGKPFEVGADQAHQRIEEAQLFIEAAHACYDRMSAAKPA